MKIMINVEDCSNIIKKNFQNDFVTIDELLDCLENILIDNEYLIEQLNDLKEDLEQNYTPNKTDFD